MRVTARWDSGAGGVCGTLERAPMKRHGRKVLRADNVRLWPHGSRSERPGFGRLSKLASKSLSLPRKFPMLLIINSPLDDPHGHWSQRFSWTSRIVEKVVGEQLLEI